MLYPICFEKVSDGYVVSVPDIAGCFSAGNTLEEALDNVKEAILCHLEGLIEDGEDIPVASELEEHTKNVEYKDFIFAVVDIDISHLLGKAEKINITVPSHLLRKIDSFVATHPEYKNRSQFLTKVAMDKVYAV
ncbi:phage-like protein [Gallibacterium salpingitidis]|uniref:Phage-like protein n=1 Tax=Gallibacterium salpingitidis TaxID=505341 RepID=A0A1A7NV88_9PAST|nr:type II toxin-antitoxin system HicB family antitoxin [Gallibacterium salpingitidis]OBW94122.1 phage-like protein [Gallibacterium salpingitidis]OBX09116.1 phage-like protein [Gallibacterium salpingitidis]OBX10929.1 phage-like protein [Gallibacterium salpingitidis]WKS99694.1 type II toxin-antitoxin system HicB family antitoxin [Gallibacterium salpingitidis]